MQRTAFKVPTASQASRLVAPVPSCRPSVLTFKATRAAHSVAHTSLPCSSSSSRQLTRSCRTHATSRPAVFLFGFGGGDDDYDEEYTVLKVQVGMFGDIRKWQKEFERLSELYDTDEEESLHFILQETVTKLLRNMEYMSYGATAGKVFSDIEACERKFNEVSMEERSKFKEETYVNVDGRRKKASFTITPSSDTGLDQWLVVTLLVAAEGKLKLPKVNSLADLRKSLTTLGSVTPEAVIAFELLWTPQADGDSYSKDELMTDFPSLATL